MAGLKAAVDLHAGCLSLASPCLLVPDALCRCLSCCLVVVSQGVVGRQAAASVCSMTVFMRLGICLLLLSHAEINTSLYFLSN